MPQDRYSIVPDRNGWDITDEGKPIGDTDLVARLNEQDDDIRRLHAALTDAHAALVRGHALVALAELARGLESTQSDT